MIREESVTTVISKNQFHSLGDHGKRHDSQAWTRLPGQAIIFTLDTVA